MRRVVHCGRESDDEWVVVFEEGGELRALKSGRCLSHRGDCKPWVCRRARSSEEDGKGGAAAEGEERETVCCLLDIEDW
jgi:hypothetical protein